MSSLYRKCHELFTEYPLAVKALRRSRAMCSVILMLQDGSHDGFFVLTHDFSRDASAFWIWSWPAGDVVVIEADGTQDVPDAATNAITQGMPIPRDGSLFGWTPGGAITALIVVYTEYSPATPEPSWAIMPLAGIPEAQWPPFAGDPLFGHWTWPGDPAGSIVSIDELVAESPDTVFWIDTKAILGSDCCAVARELTSREGHVLRRGRYVYYQALRADAPVPSLGALLADLGKIDLAPRLERSA
jgi:hypothetical protein